MQLNFCVICCGIQCYKACLLSILVSVLLECMLSFLVSLPKRISAPGGVLRYISDRDVRIRQSC